MTDDVAVEDQIDGREISGVAAELANAYREQMAFYQANMGLDAVEADRCTRGLDATPEQVEADRVHTWTKPPESVTWNDIQRLAERNPEEMVAVWQDLRREAQDELESGHRAAQALDWQRRPWARAQFLAIRESFCAGTTPTGIESALIDTAAEAYGDYLELSEQVHRMLSAEVEVERDDLARKGHWHPPHRAVADAIDRTSRLADRAHQHFLRTVKMLTEVQRSAPTLYVTHAGQINVGQQQVNLSASPPANAASRDLPK